ncbi:MAG: hypothetical protein ACRD2H_03935 [Terriglobales bacterium]
MRLGFAWHYIHLFRPGALGVLPFLFEPGNIARALVTGQGFASPLHVASGPTAWVAPVYPLLLAAFFHLFGTYSFAAFAAAALFNIVCSAAVVIPLFALGRRVGGPAVGALAAWIWAVFPNAILLPVESLWPACLAALLATCAAALALQLGASLGRRDRLTWLAFGLLWALILMTAPALLSLLPCLLIWIAVRRAHARWPWRRGMAVCAAALVLGCLPWTLRNARALHAFIPLRSDLGLALWIGNNPQAAIWPNGELHPINNGVERAAYLRLGEVAFMRAKRRAALAYLAAHPARCVRLASRRAVALWAGGAARPLRSLLAGSFAFRFVLLFNLALGFGTLLGLLVLARRRSPWFWPLAPYPVVFPIAYYLTGALPRYLLPIQPLAALLAAAFLVAAAARLLPSRRRLPRQARGGE